MANISIVFNRGFYIIDSGGPILRYPLASTELTTHLNDVIISPTGSDSRRARVLRAPYTDFVSPSGSSAEEVAEAIENLNVGVDVNIQDQHSPAVIQKFNQVHNSTTLSDDAVKYSYTLEVTDATGIVVGTHLVLFNVDAIRFSSFTVLNVASTTITVDSQIDFDYPTGTFVDAAITDMSVDGSSTPQIFGLRGTGIPPGIELDVDITRLIFKCYTVTNPTFSDFGDIENGITRGFMLRKRDGETFNIFNVKDNGEFAGIMFDFQFISATGQGQPGFLGRLTFGGQSKIGVVQRLALGEDLEIVIQDNLSALTLLEVVAEGHIVVSHHNA